MKALALFLWVTLFVLVGIDQFQRWRKGDTDVDSSVHADSVEEMLFVDYVDETYGFSMVVPQHWSEIISSIPLGESDHREQGYSVIFESPQQNTSDNYADYIMVEVLPGIETGAFDSDGSHRDVVIVDGQKAVRDKLSLVNFPFGDSRIDLTVRQAEIAQLGYTVGLYAIGTNDNARMLDDAFRALLYSFQLPEQPFRISELSVF